MADFSLTTVVIVPKGGQPSPVTKSTQDLDAGEVGFFNPGYVAVDQNALDNDTFGYFYVAQGRENTYLQGTKRSDKIPTGDYWNWVKNPKITEFYKVEGCATPLNQISVVNGWNVGCGEDITLTLRGHSSYLDTNYFNGFTRSVTITTECCACDGGDPCEAVDQENIVDQLIEKLTQDAPGINPDNITLSQFYTFTKVDNGDGDFSLQIEGKALTQYATPCDVAAFPYEYDRLWFDVWAYEGPATTVDFIVADACDVIASTKKVQSSSYAKGTSAEIAQLEKNFYSYQAGYLKHLYRMQGYNQNFESFVADGETYDVFYIKFNEIDGSAHKWGDYVPTDSMIIIAVPQDDSGNFQDILESLICADCESDSGECPKPPEPTTTTTTTT